MIYFSYKQICSIENIFPKIIPKRHSWQKLDGSKIAKYLPKLKQSMDFVEKKVESINNPTSTNYDWIKFKLFQSSINDDGSTTIFCGGPVSAMSWVPTPYNSDAENQILAVSVLPDPDKGYLLINNCREKGLIQFWNYGVLHNKTISTTTPKLEFCIAHNYGIVWCMEWCPSGCYDSAEVKDSLKRLGLLAIACSDSQVYIYTVLRPQQIS